MTPVPSSSEHANRADEPGPTSAPDEASTPLCGIPASESSRGLAPILLAYAVSPAAFAIIVVLRHLGLVARLPIWAYLAVLVLAPATSVLVEPWRDPTPRSVRIHVRFAIHITAVTVVIYMTGWGPVLLMTYAFAVLEDMETCGAVVWRAMMCWTFAGIAVGQFLVWQGWAPSFLDRSQALGVGVLGVIALAMVIRMAGATGLKKEHAESLLGHQALHDMLTGLPNRSCFYDRTEQAMRQGARDGSNSAVMLFDLDRFKEINDTLGHKYGDRVLFEVGPRIHRILRDADTLARLGGDEFCVLLPRIDALSDAMEVAERIIAVLAEPFEIDGMVLGIEASCGIAMAPDDGDNADLLLQRADVAMYVAKGSNVNVVAYTDELNVNTPGRLTLLGDLRTAIADNQLLLHYQPKANLETGEIQGVEALVRWQHPTLGLLPPGEFIPVAEHTGLIKPLTTWVLTTALCQCRQWLDEAHARGWNELSMAINLSTRSLLDDGFPEEVSAALDRWEIPPHLFELEITESAIMTDPMRARRLLTDLAELGVLIAIDDFGTGYSSLAYLKDLPVNQLKIDQSFVQNMHQDLNDAIIVRSVVDLGHNLGLQIVAEGVEDHETWDQLAQLGCDDAQGYFLAKPMAPGELMAWLETPGHPIATRANSVTGGITA
ncbi:MAG TPA: EAL domain-containing protein [Acidimicrobiales bacterium]|nr:EAL domain-containing protein [Acidimicrobiales bacterium]